jgi:chlorobactene glucosyltransferase
VQNLFFILGAVILVFQICFWLMRARDLIQMIRKVPEIHPDRPVTLPDDAPLISVIVPAHNEQAEIKQCLESVFQQDYPRCEVILVNDRSTDETAAIANSLAAGRSNFTVISLDKLPAGWTGKCHALDVGVRHASGEWFAFLDADSSLHRSALRQCYAQALRSRVSMLTLSTRFIMKGFWEKALQPVLASMSLIIFPLARVNDPSSKVASANGMFYIIERDAYLCIGGHRDVKGLAVEDIGIGKRVKAAGLGLLFANGWRVVSTRMYDGFFNTVRGWTRIISASLNYELPAAFKYLIMHAFMSLPALAVALALYVPQAQEWYPRVWLVLPAGVVLGTCVVTPLYFARLGVPPQNALLLSIGQLSLLWVFLVIIKKIWRKDALQWRGTTYDANRYEPTRLDPVSQAHCAAAAFQRDQIQERADKAGGPVKYTLTVPQ